MSTGGIDRATRKVHPVLQVLRITIPLLAVTEFQEMRWKPDKGFSSRPGLAVKQRFDAP